MTSRAEPVGDGTPVDPERANVTAGRIRLQPSLLRRLAPILAALPLFVAACAATAKPAHVWTKLGASAEDLRGDKAACTDRAVAGTASLHNESLATKAALDVFLKCMSEKGWTQVRQEQRE